MMSKKERKIEKKVEKDLVKIVLFFIGLVIVYFIAAKYFQSLNKFEYEGLTFTKEKFGEIPVFHYYYYFKASGDQLIKYNLFLRIDPRENTVPVNGDPILFKKSKPVYITLDPDGFTECDKSGVALATLSGFLTDNQLKVIGGTSDYNESVRLNQTYITCEKYPDDFVIQFARTNDTEIDVQGSCTTINVGSRCNILEAVEKFELQSILDAD